MTALHLGVTRSTASPGPIARVSFAAAIVLLLAAIVTYESIKLSFKVGRLSVPPVYDDVSYFVEASRWMADVGTRSPGANLYALLNQHAPFSTLTTVIGFKLFPDSYVGPYAANSVTLAAFLLGIAYLIRHLSLINIATCLIATACVPVLSETIAEARPDLPWGLAMGIAVGAIVYHPLSALPYRWIFLKGVLCGLAVAIKPSAFPASVVCIAFAACAALIRDNLDGGYRGILAPATQFVATGLVLGSGLFAAMFAVMGPTFMITVRYILNTLVYNRDFWTSHESVIGHLVFYSFGSAGRLTLSNWLWIGIALFMARFAIAILHDRRDMRRTLTLSAILLVAYAIPTASSVKTHFLGAMFYGIFIVFMALNYAAIADYLEANRDSTWVTGLKRKWMPATALSLMPLAIVLSLFLSKTVRGRMSVATAYDQQTISDMRLSTERVWSLLKDAFIQQSAQSRPQDNHSLVVDFSSPYPVTATTLELYAIELHLDLVVRVEFFTRSLEEAATHLAEADFSVVTSSMPDNLPGPQMGDDLIRLLDANPHVCPVETMKLLNTRVMRIYRHSDVGCDSRVPDAG